MVFRVENLICCFFQVPTLYNLYIISYTCVGSWIWDFAWCNSVLRIITRHRQESECDTRHDNISLRGELLGLNQFSLMLSLYFSQRWAYHYVSHFENLSGIITNWRLRKRVWFKVRNYKWRTSNVQKKVLQVNGRLSQRVV